MNDLSVSPTFQLNISQQKCSHINELPPKLLREIFLFVCDKTNFTKIQLTCKKWKEVSNEFIPNLIFSELAKQIEAKNYHLAKRVAEVLPDDFKEINLNLIRDLEEQFERDIEAIYYEELDNTVDSDHFDVIDFANLTNEEIEKRFSDQ